MRGQLMAFLGFLRRLLEFATTLYPTMPNMWTVEPKFTAAMALIWEATTFTVNW